MKKRNFLIAMAGISLALGMMMVGCGEPEQPGRTPFFTGYITVTDIPSASNGETFTISLIHESVVRASTDGVVVNGVAEARVVWDAWGDKDVGAIITTRKSDGRSYWSAYIAIKIENEKQKVTTDAVDFMLSDERNILGGANLSYTENF
jgi:hypothetical protein